MAQVAFFISFIAISASYFFKVETDYIRNHLVCVFAVPQVDQNIQIRLGKMKELLPKNFPAARYETIREKSLKTQPTTSISCNFEKDIEFENTVLFEYRAHLYPIFPGTSRTFDSISEFHQENNRYLNDLQDFKKVLFKERAVFEKFTADCSQIQEMANQIKLLEKHLKIDKNSRVPTLASFKPNTELRMKRNIVKQIGFARKYLIANEKVFANKWKVFLDFEPEKTLCPR